MNDAKHIAFDSFDARSCCFGLYYYFLGLHTRWRSSGSFGLIIHIDCMAEEQKFPDTYTTYDHY